MAQQPIEMDPQNSTPTKSIPTTEQKKEKRKKLKSVSEPLSDTGLEELASTFLKC